MGIVEHSGCVKDMFFIYFLFIFFILLEDQRSEDSPKQTDLQEVEEAETQHKT